MFESVLVAHKKGEKSVRPIAIGETMLRFAEQVALVLSKCRFRRTYVRLFKDVQFGLAKSGTQRVIHRIAKRAKLGVAADVTNAFNSISRDAIAAEVREHAPWLYPIFYALYGKPTKLHCDSVVIESKTGIRQGDPLSSLFFCVSYSPHSAGGESW